MTMSARASRVCSVGALCLSSTCLTQCAPQPIKDDVAFITTSPIVDGLLDAGLEHLVETEFDHILTLDNPEIDPVKVTYRLGYTPTHLYLYIETDAAEVSYHRRGYLWGDGYKLLLGRPQDEPLTNEYYDMAFSPTAGAPNPSEEQGIAVYNFSQIRKAFSPQSQSQEASWGDGTGFEALIAWSDIDPYHPWLTEKIGFNLYFAKGFYTEENGYFTYGYVVVEDEAIWDEEIERRAYRPIAFQNPKNVDQHYLRIQPALKHLDVGDSLVLQTASVGPTPGQKSVSVKLYNPSGAEIFAGEFDVKIHTTLQKTTETLDIGPLNVGLYSLELTSAANAVTTTLSVLPTIDFEGTERALQLNEGGVALGSAHTLIFKLRQIAQAMADLKPYEDGASVLEQWAVFQKELSVFDAGDDPYAGQLGPYRRAFQSELDGSYQPYTIKLPVNYDPTVDYPLLVFLHGSGQDEQSLLRRPRSNGNFIELAPYGRDMYRAYASDASQNDIVEAIRAASSSFSIDEDAIILGGFSMGGYGALRAFYENPDLYRGVAVFAGHPNLASEWLGEDHPNFLDETYLEPFADMPVFIYHGEQDAALDINLIIQMSEKLKAAGADVTTRFVAENGHEYQDTATQSLYSDWLDQVLASD